MSGVIAAHLIAPLFTNPADFAQAASDWTVVEEGEDAAALAEELHAAAQARIWKVDWTPPSLFGRVTPEMIQPLLKSALVLQASACGTAGPAAEKPVVRMAAPDKSNSAIGSTPSDLFENAKQLARLVAEGDDIMRAEGRYGLIDLLPQLPPQEQVDVLAILSHQAVYLFDLLVRFSVEQRVKLLEFFSDRLNIVFGPERDTPQKAKIYSLLLCHFSPRCLPLQHLVALEKFSYELIPVLLLESIVGSLAEIVIGLKGDSSTREQSLALLNDPKGDPVAKCKALIDYAYSFCGEISYGAVRLMILKGERWLREGDSAWEFLGEETDPADVEVTDLPPGEKLRELAADLWEREKTLAGFPTVGGKLRNVPHQLNAQRWGFPADYTLGLIEGERKIVLLWPVRDPAVLAQTVEELLRKTSYAPQPPLFRFSLAVSGRVGDDLKPFALGLEALLASPFPYPKKIRSPIQTFNWFAPVVEGGTGGMIGFLDLDNHSNQWFNSPARRYDYLFTSFAFPPGPEFFSPEALPTKERRQEIWQRLFPNKSKGEAGVWQEAFARFTNEYRPEFLGLRKDRQGNNFVLLRLTLQGNARRVVWRPSRLDQAVLLATPEKDLEFEALRRFFVEWMRDFSRQQWERVIEAAWTFEILRRAENPKGILGPPGGVWSSTRKKVLADAAADFRGEMSRLLSAKGLGRILETPWVRNKNWGAIYRDMTAYQRALAADPVWKKEIISLVEATLLEVRQIFGLESET